MSEARPPDSPSPSNRLALQFTIRFGLMALVPMALALGIAYRDARSALTLELVEKLRSVAARQSLFLTETIRTRIDDAMVIAAVPESGEVLEGATVSVIAFREFAGNYASTRNVGRVYLVGRGGDILVSAGDGPETTGNLRSPRLRGSEMARVFERASTVLEAEVSDFLIHEPTGKPAAFVAAPVLRDGRLLGAVILQLDSARELGLTQDSAGLGRTGEVLVVTQHGGGGELTYLAPTRFDPAAAFVRKHGDTSANQPLWQAAAGERGYGEYVDYRGVEAFAVWRYVPALRWGLVVKMDSREAFFPVRRLGQSFLIILGVTSVLILFATLAASRSVVLPIRRLRDAASQMPTTGLQGGLGNLPMPRNEIGDLSRSLDAMAKQLSEAFHNLEKANQTLEAKVLERTKELSAKNGELERTLGKLRSAQERMVAQARMASLGQLTKGVAHEIKNPLNFVNNFASLSKELCNELQDVLHESPNVPEPLKVEADSLLEMMRDNLNRIESHGRRADLIISGMLEHSRTVTGHEIRETDLNHAIRTSVEVAARMVRIPVINGEEESGVLDPEQLFRLRLAPEVGFVQAYPGELCRAMINVFSNAIWAVGKLQGGLQRDPVIEVTSERNPAGEVVITVRDNGIGMDEETRRQAVVPFFTTKPTGEGTGLGLSLAYDIIVQLHKGAFEMQSEPGSGTIVRMTLPEAQSLS